MERYFGAFPRVREWIEGTLESARAERLRGDPPRPPAPDRRTSTPRTQRVRSLAENAAVNTPVQGSAADIIKRAMVEVEERLAASSLSALMLLQVHDELLFEVPKAELAETEALVRECMEGAVTLDVPLAVDCGSGQNWLEAH